jgi:hypothetical protein
MSDNDNTTSPYPPHPCPLTWASPDFWWMSESDRGIAFDTRARAYGGQGYRYHPSGEVEHER